MDKETLIKIIRESYLADPLAEQGIMHCYPKEKHEYEREMAIEHLCDQILSELKPEEREKPKGPEMYTYVK